MAKTEEKEEVLVKKIKVKNTSSSDIELRVENSITHFPVGIVFEVEEKIVNAINESIYKDKIAILRS